MGSANRMLGLYRVSDALSKKAEKLYSSFLDEINYSYVLWGHANTLLCLGKYKEAEKLNKKAAELFKKWKDERGLVYVLLQEGELERNAGSKVRAVKLFKKAVEISRKHGLKIEVIHSEMGVYLTTLKGKNPIKKYDKFSAKWYSVLKKNSILNFP
jgi:tetratricopeptide (TPR) repeat protein